MIKKFHLSLNKVIKILRAFRELSKEYRARDNRVLYFVSLHRCHFRSMWIMMVLSLKIKTGLFFMRFL